MAMYVLSCTLGFSGWENKESGNFNIFHVKECILQTLPGHLVDAAGLGLGRQWFWPMIQTIIIFTAFVPKWEMAFHLNGAFELAARQGSNNLLWLTDYISTWLCFSVTLLKDFHHSHFGPSFFFLFPLFQFFLQYWFQDTANTILSTAS